MTDTADRRLGDALAAEYAAIFGYGVVGARLPAALVAQAQQCELAHRTRRDTLLVRLSGGAPSGPGGTTSGPSGGANADGGKPAPGGAALAPPPAGYALPFPVTDTASALRLATALEERTAAVWRQALPDTDGDSRRLALEALVDCALRAARWRRAAGARPGTVPFPGAPV